jgi:transcription elongation GreA/GreB family factor
VKKKAVVQKIIAQLTSELQVYVKAAHAARSEATHEQSKAENKYDTRGLEASYLARGQSKQAAELAEAIKQFEALPLHDFGPADPIDVGALVELQQGKEVLAYFVGPRAGGTEVSISKKEILVITAQSPLGQQILGHKQGEDITLEIAGSKSRYRILSVL